MDPAGKEIARGTGKGTVGVFDRRLPVLIASRFFAASLVGG